jgi:DNA invertase Pin-like site-specific DNA recombinase
MDSIDNPPKTEDRKSPDPQGLYTTEPRPNTPQKISIGYARVSTSEQDIETQLRLLRDKGVPEHLVFTDESVSGMKPPEKRHGWSQLLKFIKSGEVDTLYTYEVSRIGRSTTEAIKQIIQLEEDYKVKIIFLSPAQDILNNCDPILKPLLLSIMALGADVERKLISERTKAGLERVREQGSKSGKPIGRPPVSVDFQRIEEMCKKTGLSRNAVSKFLGYKPATFYRKVTAAKKEKELKMEKQPKNEQLSNT